VRERIFANDREGWGTRAVTEVGKTVVLARCSL
jgi:hypothetical protein